MESLLQGIPNVVVYYIDDILVTGATEQEHLKTLEEVLTHLESAGLRLKKAKCLYMVPSVDFLGHKIGSQGLQEAPKPRNAQELKSYLGLLSYYSKFLPNLPPWHVRTVCSKHQLLAVDNQRRGSTSGFKTPVAHISSVVHFDPKKKLLLSCDASAYGIGVVLSRQMSGGTEKPIALASRTLTAAERNYSQIEKEGLACVYGVKKFHACLFGHHLCSTRTTNHSCICLMLREQYLHKHLPGSRDGH